jgi:hypothetical protein
MKTKMVSYKREDIPRMTDEEVAALKARLDDPNFVIDTSDAPEMTDEQWKTAIRRRRYPAKDSVPASVEGNGSKSKHSMVSPK